MKDCSLALETRQEITQKIVAPLDNTCLSVMNIPTLFIGSPRSYAIQPNYGLTECIATLSQPKIKCHALPYSV